MKSKVVRWSCLNGGAKGMREISALVYESRAHPYPRQAGGYMRGGYLTTISTGMLTIEILFVFRSVTLIRSVYFPAASVSGSVSFFTR